MQAERNFSFVHLGFGLFYALVTLVAAVLGVLGRDRGQFVFAALFAWLALGEWKDHQPIVACGPGQRRVAARRMGVRLEPAHHSWPRRNCCNCASAHRAGTAG